MTNKFRIATREVGIGDPCFIIAEAGVNHNGNIGMAHRLVDVAAESGADAIKFQTFVAHRLVTSTASKANYQLQTTDVAESQYDMLKRLELSEQMHRELIAHCYDKKIILLSTPFDEESADLLDVLNVPAFKIPSVRLLIPFLTHVARKTNHYCFNGYVPFK